LDMEVNPFSIQEGYAQILNVILPSQGNHIYPSIHLYDLWYVTEIRRRGLQEKSVVLALKYLRDKGLKVKVAYREGYSFTNKGKIFHPTRIRIYCRSPIPGNWFQRLLDILVWQFSLMEVGF
jgi:hypothetical protein